MLAEISSLESFFPHLDFDSLLARIDTSLTKHDHGYLTPFLGAATQQGGVSDNDPEIDPATQPGAIPDLQEIFADPAEGAAICEYHRLNYELATNQDSLARHSMRALEEAFPHLNFPEILRIATTVFPEYFDHVSGAAAQSTGPNPIG